MVQSFAPKKCDHFFIYLFCFFWCAARSFSFLILIKRFKNKVLAIIFNAVRILEYGIVSAIIVHGVERSDDYAERKLTTGFFCQDGRTKAQ
jgi:hypothetical protein